MEVWRARLKVSHVMGRCEGDGGRGIMLKGGYGGDGGGVDVQGMLIFWWWLCVSS